MKILLAVDVHDQPAKLLSRAMPLLKQLGVPVDIAYLSEARLHAPADGDARRAAWQEGCDIEEAELTLLMQLMPLALRGETLLVPGAARTALPPMTDDYDLLVMGTRGQRSGLTRLVLGSVADTLIREARCAVTVLH